VATPLCPSVLKNLELHTCSFSLMFFARETGIIIIPLGKGDKFMIS
jgi:hypothetical protein